MACFRLLAIRAVSVARVSFAGASLLMLAGEFCPTAVFGVLSSCTASSRQKVI